MLARALAASVDATVRRIQFTPDLLPGDVTGVSVYNPVDREFEFKPGAIFAHIVIADEINRSSPKTQSALLEAMEEGQVTVDGTTHPLPEPFLVVATQNPLEMEGTYALPEAQRDRFMMRISMGYPDAASRGAHAAPARHVEPARRHHAGRRRRRGRAAHRVGARRPRRPADRGVRRRARAARRAPIPTCGSGASPRATLQLVRAAKVWAALDGREFVIPDDVAALLDPVFAHRLIPRAAGGARGRTSADAIAAILRASPASVRVPVAARREAMIETPWPLTVRGTGAVVLAVACFILANEVGIVELMYFGVLLVAVLGASVRLALPRRRRSDTVTRSLSPDVATVGRDALVTVRVGVRTALPTAPGRWRDTLPKGSRRRRTGSSPRSARACAERSASCSSRTPSRACGAASTRSARCRSSRPTRSASLAAPRCSATRTPVTVAPAVIDLPALVDFAGEAGGTLHTTTNQLGQGADNLIARPYVPGDSMRRIHWRATAHRDELMVRQEEQESTPEATVVLDRGVLRWSPEAMQAPGADPGFEAAVSACVSVVARLVHDGYAVEVIDSDGTVLAERIDGGDMTEVEGLVNQFATLTARRDDHLGELVRVFAGVTTGPARPDRRALRSGGCRHGRRRRAPQHASPAPRRRAGRRRARARRRSRLARCRRRPRRRSRRGLVQRRRAGGESCRPMSVRRAAAPT